MRDWLYSFKICGSCAPCPSLAVSSLRPVLAPSVFTQTCKLKAVSPLFRTAPWCWEIQDKREATREGAWCCTLLQTGPDFWFLLSVLFSGLCSTVLMQKAWVSWGQGWKLSSLAWLWAISTAGRDVSCCLWSPGTCIPPSKEPGCRCASVLLNKWSQKEPMQRDVHTGEKD